MDTVIWVAIAISSLMLAFDSPLHDKNSAFNKGLRKLDYVMTALFATEVVVKIIAQGFLFNGKKSYLRNAGNFIDFVVVSAAILSYFSSKRLAVFKIFRIIKLGRPLRLIARNENLKISIHALFAATP